MKEYIFLYLIIFFSSCNNNNNNIIRRLESSPIELSLDQIKFIKASFDSKQEQIDSGGKITLLVYSDSIVCNPCVLKTMHYWIDIIDEFKKNTNGSLNQIFIFNPKVADINKIDIFLNDFHFPYSLYIDIDGNFMRGNPHIPKDPRFHTFLLDENNNVILVGNPLHNKKIAEMYDRVIKEKIGI